MIQSRNPKYGWKPQLPDHRDHIGTYHLDRAISLPSSVDLRPMMPKVGDQLNLGSCTSWGIAGAFQYLLMKQKLHNFIPSHLFIYYNERVIEGTVNTDSGANIRDGIKVVNKLGAPNEAFWPYNVSKFAIKPPASAYTNALKNIVTEYLAVDNTNINAIKAPLAQKLPVIFGFSVYESFESEAVAKTGIMSLPKKNEKLEGGHCVCFSGDTKVSLLDGRELNFIQLCIEYANKPFWVYSCDEKGNVVPGLAHSPRKTGEKRSLVKITLDNGEIIKCTPDHKFLLRDGQYKEVKDLVIGESLMPLYRTTNNDKGFKGYEKFYNPRNKKWYFTHRSVVKQTIGEYKGVVHHKNFNKKDNTPENLEVMSWEDHTKLHNQNIILLEQYAKSEKGRQKSRELMTALWADPVWRANRLKKNAENGTKTMKKLWAKGKVGFTALSSEKRKEIALKNGIKRRGKKRSRISVEKGIKTRAEKFINDSEYRKKIQENCVKNLLKYKEDLATGKVQLTEKQRKARSENAKKTVARLYAQGKHGFQKIENQEKAKIGRAKKRLQKNNHKIISIEICESEDVFDITVEKYHNFALTAGVFVHNCAVGYNDSKKVFICRNSWSTGWGDLGYFYMPYSYITNPNLADDFWVLEMET